MRFYSLFLVGLILFTGCGPGLRNRCADRNQSVLSIRWQRLVDEEGRTCDRCGGTQQELGRAVDALRRALSPLGIRVALEERALRPQECAENIMESNRIWIADRSLEDWLSAEVGATTCESCCAQLGRTVECRTTCVEGQTYEVIPAQLIVKAGLQAASQIIAAPSAESCCPGGDSSHDSSGKCCP